jgi:hypothetical protein
LCSTVVWRRKSRVHEPQFDFVHRADPGEISGQI